MLRVEGGEEERRREGDDRAAIREGHARDTEGTQELTEGKRLVTSIVSGQMPWPLASVSLIGWGLWCYLSTGLWDSHSRYQRQDAGCAVGFPEGGPGSPDARCDRMLALSSSLGLVPSPL